MVVLADGVQVTWRTPPLAWQLDRPVLPGFETLREPGLVQVPVASILIAVPPDAEPVLVVDSQAETAVSLTAPLPIAPQPTGVIRDEDGRIVGGDYGPSADLIPFDRPVLVLTEMGVVRGVRLARLTFYPVRPFDDHLLLTETVTARVHFNQAQLRVVNNQMNLAPTQSDPWRQAVENWVINANQVQAAPMPSPNQSLRAAAAPATAVLSVDQPGIAAVTYADLGAIGFPVAGTNPHKLHLMRDGEEVALEWNGDSDAIFEPGEQFRFYAQPWASRWSNEDVYQLWADAADGLRMNQQSAAPGGLSSHILRVASLWEQDNIYTPDCMCGQLPPGRDGDRWVWDDLRQPGRPQATYSLPLDSVNSSRAASLTLWLQGFTAVSANPDHRVDVSLNGVGLGSVTWDGKTAVTRTLTIPADTLQTSNSLTLSLPTLSGVEVSGLWLDAVQIEYVRGNTAVPAADQIQFTGHSTRRAYTVPLGSVSGARVYDVTDPATPVRLTDLSLNGSGVTFSDPADGAHTYAVVTSSSLAAPAQLRLATSLQTTSLTGADYVVIAPSTWSAALDPLLALRRSQGMTTAVEDVQAIYDAYGDGRPTPAAIQAYLSDIYHAWNPQPSVVLLVGDGTSDPKQNKPDSKPSIIPPFLVDADPWLGEIAADNRFVAVDGADVLPDMAIGRLPVNTLAELNTVVNKIVRYETDPAFGDWNGRITLVADDADAAGDFAAPLNSLANMYLTDPWQAQMIMHQPPNTAVADIQKQILNQWNAGRGLMLFSGHSSVHQWGAERFFHLDDVAGLANGDRLPVVLEMTCFTGSFQMPFFDALDEALLRQPDGGAVAVWGATGLGVATGHDALAAGFMDQIFGQGEAMLGTAVLAGKLNLALNKPAHVDLVDTFTLLGDPATRYNMDLWPGHATYLPLIQTSSIP